MTWLGYPLAFALGAAYFATVTVISTALQEHLHDAVRGRVMAIYMMGFGGTVPLGLLAFGPVVQLTTVAVVLVGGAVVALAIAVVNDLREVGAPAHEAPTETRAA